jgi:alpha-methylacyl-CoA racemase
MSGGPLAAIRVVELAGIGPAPLCCTLLADLGADVLRIERPGASSGIFGEARFDLLSRGRRSCAIDLKREAGRAAVLRLGAHADVLVEGFRPGVAERLGVGPEPCCAQNPRLVYGRMTGWGQTGPLAHAAGHDINYLALTGALHAIGRAGQAPLPPLNLVADFGGGALYLAAGILAALVERVSSGRGQVVDAAMLDGVTHLMSMVYGLFAAGRWRDQRGANLLDGGAPFYDVYETSDGKYVSIGALEPQFFAELAERIGLPAEQRARHARPAEWPQLRAALAEIFRGRTRSEWCSLLEGSDACFAPVLSLAEAPEHPHNRARGTFASVDGVLQSAAAPRFERTPAGPPRPASQPGIDTLRALADWGFSEEDLRDLGAAGAIAVP